MPGAANRTDQLGAEAAVNLAAQAADMGLHNLGLRVKVKLPDVLQQHGASYNPAGVTHEIFEKLELLRLQLDPLPRARNAALEEIDLEIGDTQYRLGRPEWRAARQGIDSGE